MKAPKIDVGEPKELIRNEYRQRLGLFIDEKNEESNLIKDRMSDRMFREINSDYGLTISLLVSVNKSFTYMHTMSLTTAIL